MTGIIPIIGVSIWFIAKIMVLFGLIIYSIFAAVVVRQVQLMTDTLEVGLEKPIRFLAIAHLIFSLFVFLLALVIL